MFSPFQHLQRDPESVRWEQAAYASLTAMTEHSAALRKWQAAQWFESGHWRKSTSIAPHRWAEAFDKRATYLCPFQYKYAFNDGSVPDKYSPRNTRTKPTESSYQRKTYTLDIQALSVLARILDSPKVAPFLMRHFERIVVHLGMDDPLARGMVAAYWPPQAQIERWRQYFPEDPLANLLGVALEMNSISPPSLEGYFLSRKGLVRAQTQGMATLDLSILTESVEP